MVKEGAEHEAEDKKRRDQVEARNKADQLCYGVEKALSEAKDKLPADKVAGIEGQVKSLRSAIEKEDHEAIQSGMAALEKAMADLAQVAYGGAGGPGAPGGAGAPAESVVSERCGSEYTASVNTRTRRDAATSTAEPSFSSAMPSAVQTRRHVRRACQPRGTVYRVDRRRCVGRLRRCVFGVDGAGTDEQHGQGGHGGDRSGHALARATGVPWHLDRGALTKRERPRRRTPWPLTWASDATEAAPDRSCVGCQ